MAAFRVIYCSCACSRRVFKKIFELSENVPGQQVQKYHGLMLKGLSACENLDVVALSKIPCSQDVLSKIQGEIGESETEGNINYKYIPLMTSGPWGLLKQLFASKRITDSLIKNVKSTVAVIDVLNISQSIGTVIACKRKGIKIVGIITDLPEMMGSKLFAFLGNLLIEKCDAYLELTEAMDSRIGNKGKKPFMVMEGLVDAENNEMEVRNETAKRICMYTGSLHRIHGIDYLIDGFIKADIPNAELHLYGSGDYEDEIKKICIEHENVKFFGTIMNNELVRKQKKATLLINPRPTNQEFVKYSFPSKNMEYMISGTPMLTTKLPGMPKEYYPYVYILDKENADGLSEVLRELFNKDKNELREKGKKAKEFVLTHKSYLVQGKAFCDFIIEKVI